jgi:hypothetical protein
MEPMNKNEYQKKLEDQEKWHNGQCKWREDCMGSPDCVLSSSLYALTQLLIAKELYQLNNQ